MRPILTATDYERATRPYLFDRIEVSANIFTGPRPGNYLRADFERPTEPAHFCIIGAFYCEFQGGPNLSELAATAAEICGADGFFGLRTARRLDVRAINQHADSEGWALFDVDSSGLLEIERDDEMQIFDGDDSAIAYVRQRASEGSALHIQAIRIHDDHALALQWRRLPVLA